MDSITSLESVIWYLSVIVPVIVAVQRHIAAKTAEQKYSSAKGNLLNVVSEIADSTALIFENAKPGKTCDPDTQKKITDAAITIWDGLEKIGDSASQILKQKSDLAETLNPIRKKNSGEPI